MNTSTPTPQAGLLLRYDAANRPDSDRIAGVFRAAGRASVSHFPMPSRRGAAAEWLELLYDGLTFDCLGLAPGPDLAVPDVRHRLGLVEGAGARAAEAIGLFAGPHCAAAAASLPLVRAQLALACLLLDRGPPAVELVWTPAALAVAPQVFLAAARAWLGGGAFPALALIGYARRPGDGLTSDGLAFFTGQEVRVPEAVIADPVAATRLAARLAHELVAATPVTAREEFVAPDGQRLALVPDESGRMLGVEPA